jgi:hypothetical protein
VTACLAAGGFCVFGTFDGALSFSETPSLGAGVGGGKGREEIVEIVGVVGGEGLEELVDEGVRDLGTIAEVGQLGQRPEIVFQGLLLHGWMFGEKQKDGWWWVGWRSAGGAS